MDKRQFLLQTLQFFQRGRLHQILNRLAQLFIGRSSLADLLLLFLCERIRSLWVRQSRHQCLEVLSLLLFLSSLRSVNGRLAIGCGLVFCLLVGAVFQMDKEGFALQSFQPLHLCRIHKGKRPAIQSIVGGADCLKLLLKLRSESFDLFGIGQTIYHGVESRGLLLGQCVPAVLLCFMAEALIGAIFPMGKGQRFQAF